MRLFSFLRRSCCEALNHKEEKLAEVDFTSKEEIKKEIIVPEEPNNKKMIFNIPKDGLMNDLRFMTTDHRHQKSEDQTSLRSKNSQKKGIGSPFFEFAITPRKKETTKVQNPQKIPTDRSVQIMKMLRNIY